MCVTYGYGSLESRTVTYTRYMRRPNTYRYRYVTFRYIEIIG